jgi:hypothetical protein
MIPPSAIAPDSAGIAATSRENKICRTKMIASRVHSERSEPQCQTIERNSPWQSGMPPRLAASQQSDINEQKRSAICRKNGICADQRYQRSPRADPIIPERSSYSPFNTDAEESSSLETMSVSSEQNGGALKAKPAPIKNTKSRMR